MSNNSGATQDSASQDVQLWDAERICRRVAAAEAALSRGFLRCRPEKWFPGIAGQWLPVSHALGCEVRVSDIKPILGQPPGGGVVFAGMVSGERMVIGLHEGSTAALMAEVLPGADGGAWNIVLEYLARRLFFSLASAWSGPELSSVAFLGPLPSGAIPVAASVRVAFTINTTSVTAWFGLGEQLVQTLDGLWRRQVQSAARSAAGPASVRLEIAQLGVPPQTLSEYLKQGTVIDLEIRASELVTLRVGSRAWMPGRLLNVEGSFGVEVCPGAVSAPAVPDGTTRLAIEVGSVSMDGSQVAELSQAGAILVTNVPIGGEVSLVINQEVVGRARLCVYEGRFAIEVL